MIRNLLIPILCAFITASSLILEKTEHVLPMIAAGCALSLTVIAYQKIPFAKYVQFVSLVSFHWYSQLNWCQILYFIFIVLSDHRKLSYPRVILLAAGYSLAYTAVRLSYLPMSEYNLLVSVYDMITFVLIVFFMRYLLTAESEKRRLRKTNEYFKTHDPLTGLLNFEGYTNAMSDLMRRKLDFTLVLLDFQDFKSVNNVSISTGNEILANIAVLLRKNFPMAEAISRYAGDRFSLILPQRDSNINEIASILESKALGHEVTYSVALFPQEAVTPQAVMALAEDRLFQKKRSLWLKREEEMFRSEKMKIVGELAAGMAHEIRNPLTTMRGFMQLSKNHEYNVKPWFDIIMNEITRMNELTAEFLQFSKPHISNMKPGSIARCIERVRFLTESQAVSRGHQITLENIGDSVAVQMDKDKIVQVLLNLVRNAIEAMAEPGTLHIRAKLEHRDVVIEVEDTGSGIPEQELPKIFNPFYTTKENGTGLGLSICHKIVQDHGGSMSVRSEIGRGSTFAVKLPCCGP
jgi:diguanylate cyclase (GGDEF)-like protein